MQPTAQQQQAMDQLTRYIVGEMNAGISDAQIVASLVAQGWPRGDAESAVLGVRNSMGYSANVYTGNYPQQQANYPSYQSRGPDPVRRARREAGVKKIIVGSLFFVGGIIVTAATYAAAANGGSYVVAWGAILFGFIDIIIGLTMLR